MYAGKDKYKYVDPKRNLICAKIDHTKHQQCGKAIIIAFVMGCILGSVIHLLRMKLTNEDHVLAMGPYLAAGILLAALWGDSLLQMYMRLW